MEASLRNLAVLGEPIRPTALPVAFDFDPETLVRRRGPNHVNPLFLVHLLDAELLFRGFRSVFLHHAHAFLYFVHPDTFLELFVVRAASLALSSASVPSFGTSLTPCQCLVLPTADPHLDFHLVIEIIKSLY